MSEQKENSRLGQYFPKLSQLQVQEVVALYKLGISLQRLATKYKVSHVNLIKILEARGVERRPKGRHQKEQIPANRGGGSSDPNKYPTRTFYKIVWIEHPNGVQSSYRFKLKDAEVRIAALLEHEGVRLIEDPYRRKNYHDQPNLYDLLNK